MTQVFDKPKEATGGSDDIQLAHERGLVEKALKHGIRLLRFTKELEQEFNEFYSHRYFYQIRITVVIGLVIFGAFGVIDHYFSYESSAKMWYIRVVLDLSILAALSCTLFRGFFLRHHQHILAALTLSIGSCLIAMVGSAPPGANYYYYMGLLLLEMFGFTTVRLRFRYSVGCALFLFVVYNLTLVWVVHAQSSSTVVFNFIFLCGAVIALAANYYMEYSVRSSYLQARLLRIKSEDLAIANHRLRELADSDGLTGLVCRRLFDTSLVSEWQRAMRSQKPLILLMIDIDYFKPFNDTYGHLAGDDCLKQVSKVFKQIGNRPGDVVARYGGEEFAIILAGSEIEYAQKMAQTILEAIQGLKIPHRKSMVNDYVTISIGVASLTPNIDHSNSPQALIKLADGALYEAKERGRNQVVFKAG